jgi:hypothetical protein
MGSIFDSIFGYGGGSLFGGSLQKEMAMGQQALMNQQRQAMNTYGTYDWTDNSTTSGSTTYWGDNYKYVGTYTMNGEGIVEKKPKPTKTRTGALGWLDDQVEAVCAEGRKVEVEWM